MRESCFCGRSGELEDREPVLNAEARWLLRCPSEACGHLDDLGWMTEEVALMIWGEARRRRGVPLPGLQGGGPSIEKPLAAMKVVQSTQQHLGDRRE